MASGSSYGDDDGSISSHSLDETESVLLFIALTYLSACIPELDFLRNSICGEGDMALHAAHYVNV